MRTIAGCGGGEGLARVAGQARVLGPAQGDDRGGFANGGTQAIWPSLWKDWSKPHAVPAPETFGTAEGYRCQVTRPPSACRTVALVRGTRGAEVYRHADVTIPVAVQP
jgi:hypothetical protein